MNTLIDYLLETIMSRDALKLAMSDVDRRQLGKTDGSKPTSKRTAQMDKRRRNKSGYSEEEEPSEPARKDRTKRVMDQHRRMDDQERPSHNRQRQIDNRTKRSYYGGK